MFCNILHGNVFCTITSNFGTETWKFKLQLCDAYHTYRLLVLDFCFNLHNITYLTQRQNLFITSCNNLGCIPNFHR